MRSFLVLALLIPFSQPAWAETQMTAEDFDAYSLGKKLIYARDGVVYGTELYLPNRKVLWAPTDAACKEGYWYPDGAEICFVYENPNLPECWRYFDHPNGVQAEYTNDDPDTTRTQLQETEAPLPCAGPEVGA